MASSKNSLQFALSLTAMYPTACVPPPETHAHAHASASAPENRTLPSAALQQIADELVLRSGAPGAVLGVARSDTRWLGAAGSEDLLGLSPMRSDEVFRAASITKVFTGALVLGAAEAGKLALADRLADYVPDFPHAEAITLDMLLAHTAGVTTAWFDSPALQSKVLADPTRSFRPAEVIAEMAALPPLGSPGHSGVHYANTDFVLLGEVLAQVHGKAFGELLREQILTPLNLAQTSYGFENPPGLVSGYYEIGGSPLDMATFPQTSFLSFAGASGALHSKASDLLTFAQALFVDGELVDDGSLAHIMKPGEQGADHARALMLFCPCTGEGRDKRHSGFGHGGNLPGYWSVLVHYPEQQVSVTAMINRDVVDGVMLDEHMFDATLQAVLDAVVP